MSELELRLALDAGAKPGAIIVSSLSRRKNLAGPVVSAGVGLVNAECPEDLIQIREIASEVPVRVGLRIDAAPTG